MSVCENCVREYVWNGDNPIPGECRDCQVGLDGKPTNYQRKPKTNADRIRAMSDEELSKFLECFGLCHHCTEHHRLGDVRFYQDEKCDEQCEQHCLEWLKQPAEVDNG